ncbi:HTH-type transcriptional regulator/antitoxin HigA [Pedobacter sp. AK013]|uniref:XRE family transcriptional regulator n=1 Tax=Pedobacter sp. AK013 TaxID=2723071 RepID=UPI001616AA04|nr:XRE family transcriptional regulator [Pedobacter sp. AK013]MBB6239650.1 HTH-type transcriptional regulator/antitoxin HigA [Pedobacter sp. AK013]
MITNDRQHKITKARLDEFKHALDFHLSSSPQHENVHPKIIKAYQDSIETQISELENEIFEYEELKAGNILITEIRDLKELPLMLIKARIANGMTQLKLAEKLGMKMQQIQRYESENYGSVSLKTLIRIADSLQVVINGDVQLKPIDAPEFLDLKKYPFKQMFERNWFNNLNTSTLNDAVKNSAQLISSLLENAGLSTFKYSFNKRTQGKEKNINEHALNAWYARILIKAKDQKPQTVFNRDDLSNSWLRELAKLSQHENGPQLASEYLQNSGIRFIIEPALQGTLLDGAALLLDDLSPVIALTLRYDRLDNFWFVLFHEIAHIILHLHGELDVIFDDLDQKLDGIEAEADAYALNALIPDETWRKSLVRFSPTDEIIKNQATKLEISPALVAGRIRRETGNYTKFNNLIGLNKVRKNFSDQY